MIFKRRKRPTYFHHHNKNTKSSYSTSQMVPMLLFTLICSSNLKYVTANSEGISCHQCGIMSDGTSFMGIRGYPQCQFLESELSGGNPRLFSRQCPHGEKCCFSLREYMTIDFWGHSASAEVFLHGCCSSLNATDLHHLQSAEPPDFSTSEHFKAEVFSKTVQTGHIKSRVMFCNTPFCNHKRIPWSVPVYQRTVLDEVKGPEERVNQLTPNPTKEATSDVLSQTQSIPEDAFEVEIVSDKIVHDLKITTITPKSVDTTESVEDFGGIKIATLAPANISRSLPGDNDGFLMERKRTPKQITKTTVLAQVRRLEPKFQREPVEDLNVIDLLNLGDADRFNKRIRRPLSQDDLDSSDAEVIRRKIGPRITPGRANSSSSRRRKPSPSRRDKAGSNRLTKTEEIIAEEEVEEKEGVASRFKSPVCECHCNCPTLVCSAPLVASDGKTVQFNGLSALTMLIFPVVRNLFHF